MGLREVFGEAMEGARRGSSGRSPEQLSRAPGCWRCSWGPELVGTKLDARGIAQVIELDGGMLALLVAAIRIPDR